MKRKTTFTTDSSKNTYNFTQDGMMLRRNPSWDEEGDFGKGDALWRTSLAYIAYGDFYLLNGIRSCFRTKDGYMQAYRAPGHRSYDVSRDQVTATATALFLRGDHMLMKHIISKLRFCLSDEFKFTSLMTIDMWLWLKCLQYSSGVLSDLFLLVSCPIALLSSWTNSLLRRKLNIEIVSPEEYDNTPIVDKPESKLRKFIYPAYAFHLFSWQFYTAKNTRLKRFFSKKLIPKADPSNYVVRLLFGDTTVKWKDVVKFKPRKGLIWQRALVKGESHMEKPLGDEYDKDHNVLDNDMLWYLMEQKNPDVWSGFLI